MTNSITGSIKFFNIEKHFGFVTVDSDDYIVNLKTVESVGFRGSDMISGCPLEFIPETVDGRKRVLEIKRIGDRSPSAPRTVSKSASPPVEVGQWLIGSVDNYVAQRGFGFIKVEGFSNVFFHISQVQSGMIPVVNATYHFLTSPGDHGPVATNLRVYARNQVDAHENKKLFSVKLDGQLAFYEVDTTNEDDQVVRECLPTTCLAKAREAIGKSISHPVPKNFGKASNNPALSQLMKDGGWMKQQKAA